MLIIVIIVPIIFIVTNGGGYLSLEEFQKHHQFLTDLVRQHWLASGLLYVLTYVIVTSLSLPVGAVISITGGFLFGAALGTVLTVTAATIGAVVFYGIVRFALEDRLKNKAERFMRRMRRGFERDAFSYLFLLRLLPIFPFFIVNLVSALLHVRLGVYITATFLGIMPGSFAYNAFGSGVGEILERGEELTLKGIFNHDIIVAMVLLAFLAFLPILVKRYRLFRRLRRQESLISGKKSLWHRFVDFFKPQPLSPRVQHALVREQQRGEIFVSWAQLAVIVLFASLYSLAPKAFPDNVPFEPVPIMLGIYAVFTLIRLYLSYRGPLKNWFVALSIVVDMTVLMTTIWTFHLQYQQPPSFYLKAPTLLYVFIFITFRALRFEARWVLMAGFVAAFEWMVLLLYALANQTHDTPITRNFIDYITSNKILVGAEIDKVVSILVVSILLAFALRRAHVLLIQATKEQLASQDLSRFFAPEVAEKIKSADLGLEAGHGEVRHAAIMFIDIRGFTTLSHKMEATDLIGLLSEYQERIVPIIQQHGGSIDKFMGDGILASFGAVHPNDHYAADALQATQSILSSVAEWNKIRKTQGRPPLRLGLAVSVGEVIFGVIGHENRLEYTVIGDTVNLAAKLEKHTKQTPCDGLATKECYDLAVDQGFTSTAQPQFFKNTQVEGVEKTIDLVGWCV